VEAALGAGLWKVLVVTGHHAAQASDALPQDPCLEILTNPEPEQGMGSSLALAARRALALKARVLVVLLGDMPLIQAATVSQVAALAVKSAAGAAAARIGYRWGHPVAFGRQHFDELASLSGDQGARKLIQRLGPELSLVQAPEWSNLDVDDPGQLEQAGKILQGLRDGTL
jgi:CTP:molybdopterin cytidylyltransferase MocA